MKKNIKYLTQGAVFCALYVCLGLLQNLLFPGSASFAIQFRVAESLCVLALFTPAAIGGLTLGCFLFNLSYSAALPLDAPLGSLATFLALSAMYLCRKVTFRGCPVLSLLMPAVLNGLIVGLELTFYFGGGFFLNAFYVALGEILVLFSLGLGLQAALRRHSHSSFS